MVQSGRRAVFPRDPPVMKSWHSMMLESNKQTSFWAMSQKLIKYWKAYGWRLKEIKTTRWLYNYPLHGHCFLLSHYLYSPTIPPPLKEIYNYKLSIQGQVYSIRQALWSFFPLLPMSGGSDSSMPSWTTLLQACTPMSIASTASANRSNTVNQTLWTPKANRKGIEKALRCRRDIER